VRYLLDTDSLSYFFRGEGQVAAHLKVLAPTDIGIPAPVLYESRHGMLRLASGARRTALLAALDRAVDTLEVIAFDARATEAAAQVRTQLEALGIGIGPVDVQIAGIALARSMTLVTRNTKEFSRVSGLAVENWYDGGDIIDSLGSPPGIEDVEHD
jgi:tRNA(fMet)-specific endonuclease VapC